MARNVVEDTCAVKAEPAPAHGPPAQKGHRVSAQAPWGAESRGQWRG